jgi:DNA replication ATP-dependent helicase Dna2
LREGSRDANFRAGDFLCALSPELRPGFLDEHSYSVVKGTSLEARFGNRGNLAESGLTGVSVEAIDRTGGFIALRAGPFCCITQLESETSLMFDSNVILDPISKDFLIDKISLTVRALGSPPGGSASGAAAVALGVEVISPESFVALTPAAEVLWEAPLVYEQAITRKLSGTRTVLEFHLASQGASLDPSQWQAWTEALSRRLTLIWGPPGTGKSRTLRAIVQGAALEASHNKRPLRVLISAQTYTAIDNVLLKLDTDLRSVLPEKPYTLNRVQSKWETSTSAIAPQHPDINWLVLNSAEPDAEIKALRDALENPTGICVVGCTPQQLHNLAIMGKVKGKRQPKHTLREWFDLIILDEASQVDIPTSTLIFTKLAATGCCILAGDDLQLPPIQSADAPLHLEHVVGSAYNYFRRYHELPAASLDVNYRSNATLVEFIKQAGYSENLVSNSPHLKLRLVLRNSTQPPADWPSFLCWSNEWELFLNPDYSAVSFVYDDDLSSQTNDFEADAVASILYLLHERLSNQLQNECKPDGTYWALTDQRYSKKSFWEKAVGVVTPHRAQQAKIVHRLQQVFGSHPTEDIRKAVDTVERFQGQQRDVIIASFGIGDPDIIRAEDEFLFNLNRFNVLASRARAKLIVFITRTMLEHLSDDLEVLEQSRLLKRFVETYCASPRAIQLGALQDGIAYARKGVLRQA